ncbi:MAG: tetratricopeptide repeat protein [Rhodoblastus sp.]
MSTGKAMAGLVVALCLALGVAWRLVGWSALWASPDQHGRRLFEQGRYQAAADAFLDPMWRGVALMRAGNFKDAATALAGIDTAEGAYDHGNALTMLGKYSDATARYDRALALRPDYADAAANRRIAQLRAERMKAPGGDAGDQRLGADEIVYDKDARNSKGQDTATEGAPMSDEAVRALWLKRVQTRPADFLRARFSYQLQAQQERRR